VVVVAILKGIGPNLTTKTRRHKEVVNRLFADCYNCNAARWRHPLVSTSVENLWL